LVIFALIAFSLGTRSASTKFFAKALTSTPEPAPRDVTNFCADALLAAATAAVDDAKAELVAELNEEVGVVVAIKISSPGRSALY
jgi:hypothetical protein